jgi:hypothetical protein
MRKQKIKFRDPVVQCVVNKFVWLNHLQEELMDATLYLQRLKEEISTLREEKALLNELQDIDVIDNFEQEPPRKEKYVVGRGDHYSFTIDDLEWCSTCTSLKQGRCSKCE